MRKIITIIVAGILLSSMFSAHAEKMLMPSATDANPGTEIGENSVGVRISSNADGVRTFVLDGKPFIPIGVNYLVDGSGLDLSGKTYKTFDMFDPAVNNQQAIDENLQNIAANGFTYVRLWLKGGNAANGFSSSRGGSYDQAVWNAYVDKIVTTIHAARQYGLQVVLTGSAMGPSNTVYIPPNYLKGRETLPNQNTVGGINAVLMVPEMAEALGTFYKDLLSAMKKQDPGIASSIFYFDMLNEVHYDLSAAPFSQSSGTYQYTYSQDGRLVARAFQLSDFSIDPKDASSRQALMDLAARQFTETVGSRIKSVMPGMLVTMSSGINLTMGHKRFDGGLVRASLKPNHYSLRPYSMLKGGADLIDVHFYPAAASAGNGMIPFHERVAPAMISQDLVEPGSETSGTLVSARMAPLIAGEFGTEIGKYGVTLPTSNPLFASQYLAALPTAVTELQATKFAAFCTYGFSGFAFWSWDGQEGPGSTFFSLVTNFDPGRKLMTAIAPKYVHAYCGQKF